MRPVLSAALLSLLSLGLAGCGGDAELECGEGTHEEDGACVAEAVAVTSLAVSSTSGLLYGSASSGELFAFNVEERQVFQRWQMRIEGTPLIGVPETYGVIYLTCCRDGHLRRHPEGCL